MSKPPDEKVRVMRCPLCGHECTWTGIGAIYCGPHKVGNLYFPARQMLEVKP